MKLGQFMFYYQRKNFSKHLKNVAWKLVSDPFVFVFTKDYCTYK